MRTVRSAILCLITNPPQKLPQSLPIIYLYDSCERVSGNIFFTAVEILFTLPRSVPVSLIADTIVVSGTVGRF